MKKPCLHIHVGVHKTATSHLQKSVGFNRDIIEASGAALYLPKNLRPHLGAYLNQQLFEGADNEQADLTQIIDFDSIKLKRLHLLLEENILGRITKLHNVLYPRAAKRLQLVVDAFGLEDVRIFIGLRSYADYYRSAYVEFLRGTYHVTFEEFLGSFDWQNYSWQTLLEQIMECVRADQITVYDYANYRELFPVLIEEMTALPAVKLRTDSGEQIYPSPSNKALEIVANSRHILSRDDRTTALAALEAVFPKTEGENPLDYWSAESRSLLEKQYKKHLEQIKRRYPSIKFLSV